MASEQEQLLKDSGDQGSAAQQAARIIRRYPDLSDGELGLAINLYRELSALEMALMISDGELGAKLDHFYQDNRRQLRTPFRQYAVLVCIAAVGIIIAFWAALFGAK